MKRTWNGPALGSLIRASALLAAGLVGVTDASAQNLPLPVPSVSLTSESRRAILAWDEAPATAGRAISNLRYFGFDATTPPISLVGAYAVDCDYFLRVTKDPISGFDQPPSPSLPNGRDVRVKLKYQLWTNSSNIGSPLVEDSLSVRQPDTPAFFDAQLVGPLGIGLTIGSNVNQPTTSLGTIPVTVTGLGAGVSAISRYFVSAEAPGSLASGGGSITVRVVGSYQNLPPSAIVPDSVYVITTPDVPVKVMDGMYLTFGTGSTAPGDSVFWTTNHIFPLTTSSKIEANLEAFEGYHVWRADLPDPDAGFTLLGEIIQCDSKFEFNLLSEDETAEIDLFVDYDPAMRRFTVTDRDVHDDFPYRYAVSTFDRGFLGNREDITYEGVLAETRKIYPANQSRLPGAAYAVPNPYKRNSPWEEGDRKIVFANLPPACSIRIYTVATELVATIEHGPGQPKSTSPTSTSWDLLNDRGEEVSSGIYIFYIESADGFRQSGKVMIAR